ncbi:MAG TPA: isoprenyl transferase [Gammaproteobacteria bacterium]|jgi:undecaprenyl diphosphate synthase|nr:isoprenyl transferase [Gammaproteobacteria bacterium]
MNLPRHIAIIMDGNGRWAKQKRLPRVAGHRAGVEVARETIKLCIERQIEVLSLFAFSSENWQRPEQEVTFLMRLFFTALDREKNMLHEHNVQLRFIGDRARFDEHLREKIAEAESLTARNTGLVLIVAADYGGQWDICQAVRQLALEVESGRLSSDAIDHNMITSKLSFADLPDPDLFIRTSGEFRISNFMLWQMAYTELYFTDVLWPDFDQSAFELALKTFSERERRFGTI